MRATLVILLSFACASSGTTQGSTPTPEPRPSIGWQSVKFHNPGKTGAKVLHAVVHYPAAPGSKRDRKAPLLPGKGSLPIIVFLHGFGATGGMMISIGQHFAEQGYVVVLTNTTRTDRAEQATNASAFFAALEHANNHEDSFLAGRLDMNRVGIAGHSMGGGNAMRVLGDGNPGYKAGFCFAPWTTKTRSTPDYVDSYAKTVDTPLAIVHGIEDRVLPWRANAMRLYEAVAEDDAFKVFWVLGEKATHVNVAVPSMLARDADPTFQLCAGMATGFFDRFLRGEATALDAYLDPDKKPEGVQALHSNQLIANGNRKQD